MLRITITDTKTNKTVFETFARCICAGISEDEDKSRCVFYQQSNGISIADAGHCLESLDDVRKQLMKLTGVKAAYWTAKLFSKKEKRVIE